VTNNKIGTGALQKRVQNLAQMPLHPKPLGTNIKPSNLLKTPGIATLAEICATRYQTEPARYEVFVKTA
jgi:hypothetical protein